LDKTKLLDPANGDMVVEKRDRRLYLFSSTSVSCPAFHNCGQPRRSTDETRIVSAVRAAHQHDGEASDDAASYVTVGRLEFSTALADAANVSPMRYATPRGHFRLSTHQLIFHAFARTMQMYGK